MSSSRQNERIMRRVNKVTRKRLIHVLVDFFVLRIVDVLFEITQISHESVQRKFVFVFALTWFVFKNQIFAFLFAFDFLLGYRLIIIQMRIYLSFYLSTSWYFSRKFWNLFQVMCSGTKFTSDSFPSLNTLTEQKWNKEYSSFELEKKLWIENKLFEKAEYFTS